MSLPHGSGPAYPLTERVIDVLEENGPTSAENLSHYVPGADRIDIDAALSKLQRENRVSLWKGKYDLVAGQKPREPAAAKPSGFVSVSKPAPRSSANPDCAPPSADEEVCGAMPEARKKRCKGKCGLEKPLTDFTKHAAFADGLDNRCRPCRQEIQRAQRANKSTTTQSGPEPGSPNASPGASVGGSTGRDATAASDTAERRSGDGDDIAGPRKESAPDTGDRQSPEPTLGKVALVRVEPALTRKGALIAQIATARAELEQIEQFLSLYDRFCGTEAQPKT